jgi:hypothetical protein
LGADAVLGIESLFLFRVPLGYDILATLSGT